MCSSNLNSDATKNAVITGVTGFLGSHFLYHIQRLPHFYNISALVRAEDKEHGLRRIKSIYQNVSNSYRNYDAKQTNYNINVVNGDIEFPNCRVSESEVESIKEHHAVGQDLEFWHFASSLNFEETQREKIEKQNLEGIQNAFELALKCGAKRFVYISTAYTAGAHSGEIKESLHNLDRVFSNVYEETKCKAEHIITELCGGASIDLRIIRPSIVIGVSTTYLPGGSDTGLYGFVRQLYRLKRAIDKNKAPVHLEGIGDTKIDFIPIDNFCDDILYLIENNFPSGPVYHCTSSRKVALQEAVYEISRQLSMQCPEIVVPGYNHVSTLDKLVARRMVFYSSYMKGDKDFQRSLPGNHGIDLLDLSRFVAEGIRSLTKETILDIFDYEKVEVSDGVKLRVFHSDIHIPDKPCVLFVIAYGMPIDFLQNIAATLKDKYRLLAWETRGVPSNINESMPDDLTVYRNACDGKDLLEHYGIKSANVLGWCTGTVVSLELADKHPELIDHLVLMNGSYSTLDSEKTSFETNIATALSQINDNQSYADIYCKLIYEGSMSNSRASDSKLIDNILYSTDANLLHLTSTPFQTSEKLVRYAKLATNYLSHVIPETLTNIRIPTLVVTGTDDVTAHPAGSIALSEILGSQATLFNHPGGDHFMILNEPSVFVKVGNFLKDNLK